MVWRSVIVSKPAKLKREHFALVVEQEQSARVQPTTGRRAPRCGV